MKADSGRNVVAVYWDFENIHASLYELKNGHESYRSNRFTSQERLVNIRAVMDYVASVGDVAVNRAYSNWNFLSRYRDDFNEVGVDLIQIYPRGANAKNGADIRLALDALEDIYRFPYLTHIIIVGGDSDYVSLAQKVKQANLTIIGIGVQETTNSFWVQCCNEFKYYKNLLDINRVVSPALPIQKQAAPSSTAGSTGRSTAITNGESNGIALYNSNTLGLGGYTDLEDAKELMLRAVRHLVSQSGEAKVLKAKLKPMMVRMHASFDEVNYGFPTFSSFLDAFPDVILNVRDDSGGYVQLVENMVGTQELPKSISLLQSSYEMYERVLKRRNLHILPTPWWREAVNCAEQVFANAPENRLPSFEYLEQELAKVLEQSGFDSNPELIHKIRGNMYVLWQFLLLNEKGIKLKVTPGKGSLLKSMDEEIVRQLIRFVPPPLDVKVVAEVLFGKQHTRDVSEIEALIEKVTAPNWDGLQPQSPQ